jgi:hypothetical protein
MTTPIETWGTESRNWDSDRLVERAMVARAAIADVLEVEERIGELTGWSLASLLAARESLEEFLRLAHEKRAQVRVAA